MKVDLSLSFLQALLLVACVPQGAVAETQESWLGSLFSSWTSTEPTSVETRGLRRLSWVHPHDDDDVSSTTAKTTAKTAAADDDDSTSSTATSTGTGATPAAQHGVSAEALTAAKDDDDTTSSSASSTSSTTTKSASSNSTATSTTTAAKTTNSTKSTATTTTTTAKPSNSTKNANATATADDAPPTAAPVVTDPVVDDILQFLDDDQYQNSTTLLPPEKDQPASWPIDVFGIFVGVAVLLCAVTAFKNYRKRSKYQEVPTSLVV